MNHTQEYTPDSTLECGLLRQTILLSAVPYVRDRPQHYNSGKYFPKPHSSIEHHTNEPHLQKY